MSADDGRLKRSLYLLFGFLGMHGRRDGYLHDG
jgi:hypothetical protein